MYNPQLDIVHLMDMYDQKVETHPTLSDHKTRLLRGKLTLEETKEFFKGLGLFLGMNDDGELDVFEDPDSTPNLDDIYDAIVDMNVVNYGAANAFGLNVTPGHDEVQRSNKSKLHADGSVHKNEFGKVIKPASYSPADLHSVVEKLKANKFSLREQLEAE